MTAENDPSPPGSDMDALNKELESLRRRYPDDAVKAQSSDAVICPLCGGAMAPGSASVRTSIIGFILGGSSFRHLWFHRRGRHKLEDQVVVGSGDTTDAWQCDKCHATLVKPSRSAWMAH
ncbi:hypothetical protein [Humisphaera borealis]|uniref:Uncharacterized protein n=1 Tax=Humisphaera borealis TaxID=2807512 RepID=A0A7M2WUG7_9BACT|nr:hypothetical protein [Humisphaera borealis]QOV89167.1 hypothetical protein IPV69_23600 [Humisphaera borealis]